MGRTSPHLSARSARIRLWSSNTKPTESRRYFSASPRSHATTGALVCHTPFEHESFGKPRVRRPCGDMVRCDAEVGR